jgi:hypothetical protein
LIKTGDQMREFNIDLIKKSGEEIKELAAELRKELSKRQSYYVKLTGISKQHINYFIHSEKGFSIDKLIYIYECIQADDNVNT